MGYGALEAENFTADFILEASVPSKLAVHLRPFGENHLTESILTKHQCLGLKSLLHLIQNHQQQTVDLTKLAFLEKILSFLDQFGAQHLFLEW